MSLLYISQEKVENKDLQRYALENNYQYFFKEFNDLTVQYANDRVLAEYESVTTNEDGTVYGFMLGEIYDIEEKRAELKVKHRFISDSDIEYLIHLYEEYGIEALEDLNGRFVVFLVNTALNEYILITDRYGSYRYFYALNKEKYDFCNDPVYLVDFLPKRKLNSEAVDEFFNFGYVLGNKTLLQGINLLGGASIVNLKTGNLSIKRYWDWSYLQKSYTKSFEEAVTELGELWLETIKKILIKHPKFLLPLSGGLDSRGILAAVDYLGAKDKIDSAYTFGQKGCLDIIIAKQLAKIAGINHVVFELNADNWWQNIDSAVDNTFGARNIIEAHSGLLSEIDSSYPVLSGVLGGETCGGDLLKKELMNITTKDISDSLFKHLRKQKGIRNTRLLKNYKKSEINFVSGYNSKDLYLVATRGLYFIDVKVLGERFNYIEPFMDNKIIDFIYSLPDEWRLNRRIYKQMLLKFFPDYFSGIPWQKDCSPIEKRTSTGIITKRENKNRKQLVLFGASSLGIKAIEVLKYEHDSIYFCDNDKKKWGHFIKGIKIISPFMLKKLSRISEIKVFITSMYWREISSQLLDLGITNFEVFQQFRDYRNYDRWLRTPGIYERVYEILLSPRCKKRNHYHSKRVKKTLSQHKKGKIDAAQDIGLLVTFELFCRRFLDISDETRK